ncbi:hypothetical protein L3X38_033821 [Prunus dulcis]|uniref:Uncharacterized protein n=1 Tax=Prunus dulcis TaxID=3755 RepID=A0AAD4VHX8_PRUDU|nr:hypothetical protein L3X38_033821 [Prunus dulcis]
METSFSPQVLDEETKAGDVKKIFKKKKECSRPIGSSLEPRIRNAFWNLASEDDVRGERDKYRSRIDSRSNNLHEPGDEIDSSDSDGGNRTKQQERRDGHRSDDIDNERSSKRDLKDKGGRWLDDRQDRKGSGESSDEDGELKERDWDSQPKERKHDNGHRRRENGKGDRVRESFRSSEENDEQVRRHRHEREREKPRRHESAHRRPETENGHRYRSRHSN